MGPDAMRLYGLARRLRRLGVPLLPGVLTRAIHVLCSSHVPAEAVIGEGTRLGYGGMGVAIHGGATIGRHCMIGQGATIGAGPEGRGAPRIGDHVRIGAGAVVQGEVVVGDFAVIGANAVVLGDVPRAAVVVGVPARVVRVEPGLERCARCEAERRR